MISLSISSFAIKLNIVLCFSKESMREFEFKTLTRDEESEDLCELKNRKMDDGKADC